MSKRILVIDDEESIRKSFVLVFEETGYQVKTAASGEDGLSIIKDYKPDVIFLDLKMPRMNGIEVLEKIRAQDEKVPIYIVTAFHKEFLEALIKARNRKLSFELFRKPLGKDEILNIVKGILDGAAPI